MMKRMRTVGEPPKFRRGAKGRTTSRLGYGESVYMSLHNLVYLKLATVWLGCIVLDFLVGFRFELLWPVWLLIRHLYESLRTHAFASSLHYSAFSVFFVCVTATSDLVCYLFIPLQVLVFIASTYVWVQFVYSSTERGICLPSVVLWTLFVVFEYCVRYRFDNATTWYLARSSWLTAGLLPSTAESIVVGGSGTASSGSAFSFTPRLELCRPFAAHSVGFPLVTLGFRVKSLFSGWRMRIRRMEVRRQNEYLEKVLADAVPQAFDERRHHFISSDHYSATTASAALEQEGVDAGADSPYTEIYSPPLPLPPLYGRAGADERGGGGALQTIQLGAAVATPSSAGINGYAVSGNGSQVAASKSRNPAHHKSSALTASGGLAQQHSAASSSLVQRRGGGRVTAASCWRNINSQASGANSTQNSSNNEHGTNASSGRKREAVKRLIAYPSRNEPLVIKLWRYVLVGVPKLLITALLSAIGSHLFNEAPPGTTANGAAQDDSLSVSGDGSNMAEEESDQDECTRATWAHQQTSHQHQQSVGRKRGKKMAKQLASMTKCNSATNLDAVTTNGNANSHRDHSPSNPTPYEICNGKDGELDSPAWSTIRAAEMQQLQRAKSDFEQLNDKLRADLKLQRTLEGELRSQLAQLQNDCQQHRDSASQSKSKVEQLEGKCKNLAKQNETMRANYASLEKRAGELQARKAELERELTNERSNSAKQTKQDDLWASKSNEFSDPSALIQSLKSKSASLEREMKALRRELRSKEDQMSTLEEDLRLLRSLSRVNNDNEWKRQLEEVEQKNFLLEQTLSSENRLKQDLFRALNDSKAQIARLEKVANMKENGAASEFGGESPFGAIATPPPPPPAYSTLIGGDKSSDTPPPISVAPSLNLDQLMQITGAGKHMSRYSYSFAPPDNGDESCDGYKTPVGETLPGLAISDLTVGSQRHASQQAASHHQPR